MPYEPRPPGARLTARGRLADAVAHRLTLAGISRDDPGLRFIRWWNAVALERARAADARARRREAE